MASKLAKEYHTLRMKTDRSTSGLNLGLAVIILLFATANLLGVKQLWGINFLKFYSPGVAITITIVLILIALPPISRRLLSFGTALSQYLDDSPIRCNLFLICLIATLLPVMWAFRSATTLLGDGALRTNQALGGISLMPTELLDFLLHSVGYKYLFEPLRIDIISTYQIISVLCGIVFIIGIWRLARYMAREQAIILFGLLVSSAVLVLFFGYVESYSLIAAILPHLFLAGLKVIDGAARKWPLVVLATLAMLTHSIALFIFGPTLIIALLTPASGGSDRRQLTSRWMLASLMLLIVGACIARIFGTFGILQNLMPLLPVPEYRQGIFTANHFLNLLNWLALAALPVLLLGWRLILQERNQSEAPNGRRLFAFWMLIPSLIFIFFFTPQLGGPRDWDLFALPAFMLIPSVQILYRSRLNASIPQQVIPVIFISLVTTFGFAALNADRQRSVERFAEIMEVSKFKNLTKEYSILVNETEQHAELSHRRTEFLLKTWEQPPYTLADSMKTLNRLTQTYLTNNDRERAMQYLGLGLRADSLDLNIHASLADYLRKYGSAKDLLDLAGLFQRRFGDRALGQMNAGVIYLQNDRTELGGRCLERAWQLDPDNPQILINFGVYQIQRGDYTKCAELMRTAIEKDGTNFRAFYYAATAYVELGRTDLARHHLDRARLLARTSSERDMVAQLADRLR